jgi:hypothetical protein
MAQWLRTWIVEDFEEKMEFVRVGGNAIRADRY